MLGIQTTVSLTRITVYSIRILFFFQVHGTVGEPWWIWVEDPTNDHIYHSENFLVLKKQVNMYIWLYPYYVAVIRKKM